VIDHRRALGYIRTAIAKPKGVTLDGIAEVIVNRATAIQRHGQRRVARGGIRFQIGHRRRIPGDGDDNERLVGARFATRISDGETGAIVTFGIVNVRGRWRD